MPILLKFPRNQRAVPTSKLILPDQHYPDMQARQTPEEKIVEANIPEEFKNIMEKP